MNAFNYENIWITVSFWSLITTGTLYVLLVISGSMKTFIFNSAIGLFLLSLVAIGVFVPNALDKEKATENYQTEVTNHIKTVGQFDTVVGNLGFEPETPSTYKVTVGEAEGICMAAYPLDMKGALEFACGSNLVPLEKAKADLLESSKKAAEDKKK